MMREEVVLLVDLLVRTRNTRDSTSQGIAPSTHLLEVAAQCLIIGMNLREKRKKSSTSTNSVTKAQMKTRKERMRIKSKTNNRGAVSGG